MAGQFAFLPTMYKDILVSYLCQYLLSLIFFVIAIKTDVKWYLIVVLIFISLISDTEHLFICQLTICMSSLKNVYSVLLLIFKLSFFFCWSCMISLCILVSNSLANIVCKIFLHSVDYLFILLIIFFVVHKLFIFM